MTGFFSDQSKFEFTTLEEENEKKIPRDRFDRPLIWLPDGSKRVPYARASSYGGKLENTYNLDLWQKRQIVRGMAIDRSLADRVPQVALDRKNQSEQFTRKDKDALNAIAEQAQEAAGSNDKAGLGTAIHAATEYVDRGESLDGLDELLRNRANAYYKATREYGIRPLTIETFGVEDENEVAGTWDRTIAASWFGGKQRIGDVKTSGSMDFAGMGFMVQLAEYAHMCAYELDGTRTPHENMDLEVGIIIHVSREMDGPVEIFAVDIGKGWKFARLSREIIIAQRKSTTNGGIVELDAEWVAIQSAQTREELLELWTGLGDQAQSWRGDFERRAREIQEAA